MHARVISIGAMAANDLWDERDARRTGHATTTLIESSSADERRLPVRLLVDPGLPEPALVARLGERANLGPHDITHVFLTSFRPDTRRALHAFDRAEWLIAEAEREAVGVHLVHSLRRLTDHFEEPDADVRAVLEADIALLQRCRPAPDRLAEGVDLFPLPGVTPGLCGLLLPDARHTLLVCGDAIPTAQHLDKARLPTRCHDREAAMASFQEAVEVADLLILGRDNLTVNPTRRPF